MDLRQFRNVVVAASCALILMPTDSFAQKPKQQRYQVAACDWMMLKRQRLGEFQLAKDIGADGVELDMGPLGQRVLFDNKLRDPQQQKLFRRTADSLGVKVHSMAMSGFFAQNLLKRDNYMELLEDCISSMRVMGSKIVFLPLGGSDHMWEPTLTKEHREMVKRLHEMGERARQAGITIGIRTAMSADYDVAFLKEINSPGIKIYFNMQDVVDRHRDVSTELKKLGKQNICQIHASLTDSVTLDRDPRIDLREVKRTLDEMQWSGWLVVERSRNASNTRDVRGNYGTNVRYMKKIFQEGK